MRTFLEEYERVDFEYRNALTGKNIALRIEVNRLEKEIAELHDPEETRDDGERVRKDRWERGFRNIAAILFGNSYGFEVEEVVERVRELASKKPKKKRALDSSPAKGGE